MRRDVKPAIPNLEKAFIPWMWLILFLFLASILATVGFYFYNFRGGLSSDPEEWSAFGSYVGGLLGPIFSFISLIGLYVTVQISIRALQATVSGNEIQKLHNLIMHLEEEITAATFPNPVPPYNGPAQPRPQNEYRALQHANRYRLLYYWLTRVTNIDKYDALAIHICDKHSGAVSKLSQAGWFKAAAGSESDAIAAYYAQQAARLHRDDI